MDTLQNVFHNPPAVGIGVSTRPVVVNPAVSVPDRINAINNPPAVSNRVQKSFYGNPGVTVPDRINAIELPTAPITSTSNAASLITATQVAVTQVAATPNVAPQITAMQNTARQINATQATLLRNAPTPAASLQVPNATNNAFQNAANAAETVAADRPLRGFHTGKPYRAWYDDMPNEAAPRKTDAWKPAAGNTAPQTTGHRQGFTTPTGTNNLNLPTPPDSPSANNGTGNHRGVQPHHTPSGSAHPLVAIAGEVDNSIGEVGVVAGAANLEAGHADTEGEIILNTSGFGDQVAAAAGDGDGDGDNKAGKCNGSGSGCRADMGNTARKTGKFPDPEGTAYGNPEGANDESPEKAALGIWASLGPSLVAGWNGLRARVREMFE